MLRGKQQQQHDRGDAVDLIRSSDEGDTNKRAGLSNSIGARWKLQVGTKPREKKKQSYLTKRGELP
jgi:hypothetical protein